MSLAFACVCSFEKIFSERHKTTFTSKIETIYNFFKSFERARTGFDFFQVIKKLKISYKKIYN